MPCDYLDCCIEKGPQFIINSNHLRDNAVSVVFCHHATKCLNYRSKRSRRDICRRLEALFYTLDVRHPFSCLSACALSLWLNYIHNVEFVVRAFFGGTKVYRACSPDILEVSAITFPYSWRTLALDPPFHCLPVQSRTLSLEVFHTPKTQPHPNSATLLDPFFHPRRDPLLVLNRWRQFILKTCHRCSPMRPCSQTWMLQYT